MGGQYNKTCIRCGAEFLGSKNSRYCEACCAERKLEHKRDDYRRNRAEEQLLVGKSRNVLPSGGDAVGRGITHTVEETAAHFGTTRQNICSIEHRAMRKLRKELARLGYNNLNDIL